MHFESDWVADAAAVPCLQGATRACSGAPFVRLAPLRHDRPLARHDHPPARHDRPPALA